MGDSAGIDSKCNQGLDFTSLMSHKRGKAFQLFSTKYSK